MQALQRELDFDLDEEELGGDAGGTAAAAGLHPRHSRALEQALQRELSGGSEVARGGGSRSPHATATVNGVYRSSTDEAPLTGGKL